MTVHEHYERLKKEIAHLLEEFAAKLEGDGTVHTDSGGGGGGTPPIKPN